MTADRINLDRRAYLELHAALERERRLVQALLRPFVLADCILDDPSIAAEVKVDLLRAHHRRAKELETLVYGERTKGAA